MKNFIILIVLSVIFLFGCLNSRKIPKSDYNIKIEFPKNEVKIRDSIINIYMDSLKTIEGKVIFIDDCINDYRKEILTDLYEKKILQSDLIGFIEMGGDCILFPGENYYRSYVYTSVNNQVYYYHWKRIYSDQNVFIEWQIYVDTVERTNYKNAILNYRLEEYIKQQKIYERNKCTYKLKYSLFTKDGNNLIFWKKQVYYGERECIQ